MQMTVYCKIVQALWKDCRSGRLVARWLVLMLLFGAGGVALYVPSRAGALAAPGGCPDEVLRSELNSSFLPDCRAYEMVTPPYKEGYPLLMVSYASDGDRAILSSLATLTGNPGSTETLTTNGSYLDTRTATGWQLAPLNSPLSKFVGQLMLAAEANDGETLWSQHTPAQPLSSHGLYVRSASGVFNFVGPLGPTENPTEEHSNVNESEGQRDVVVGTTSNFTHIIVEANFLEGRWPFDTTAGNETHSLYEYSGIANKEPVLVGVIGEKGSQQLIATCGTTLGAGTAISSYNAISSDGETVFFTVNPCGSAPATAEVYARLHGGSISAAPGETVDVSESECTVECGVASGKNFEGASEDGTRVFFTSTQKLTNSAIDGTSGGSATETERGCAATLPGTPVKPSGCNLYEYDFLAPLGERLKSVSVGGGVLGVVGIAEDGSRVYYVSRAVIGSAEEGVFGRDPVLGQPNLYVYDSVSDSTSFVATLAEGDRGDWRRAKERPAVLAGGDGRVLLFASSLVGLTPDARSGVPQLFEYRSAGEGEAAELVRVTKGEDGFNEDGNGPDAEVEPSFIENVGKELGSSRDFKTTTNKQDLSSDGRTVVFAAGLLSPLATAASQHCSSLYEFHSNGALSQGSVHLLSDGRDTQIYRPGVPCGVLFQAMDAGATNVLFESADPLLGGDVDGSQFDIYDARVDGGFGPSPSVGACGGGLCEGAVSGPPAPPVAGAAAKASVAPAVSAAPTVRARPKPRKGKRRKAKACRGRRAGKRGCARRHEAKAGMLSGRSR